MSTPPVVTHSKHQTASRNDAKKSTKKPPRAVSAKKKPAVPEPAEGSSKRRGSISMSISDKVVTLIRPATPEAKTTFERPTSAPLTRPNSSEPHESATEELHNQVKETSKEQQTLEEQEPLMSEEEVSALLLDTKKRIIDLDVTFGKLKQSVSTQAPSTSAKTQLITDKYGGYANAVYVVRIWIQRHRIDAM